MHAQDIKMLTVLEPCDGEYRVRVLLQLCGQGVTSFLIGDIRVPAAASYLQFRWVLLLLFLIYSSQPPLSLFHIALISSLLWWCPLVCIWSGGTVQEHPCCMRAKRWRECGVCERERQRFAVCRVEPQLDIWGRLTYSQWHRHVINRINLSPNALMIAVLIYVNQLSLLTHYHQFAPDIHNRPLLALTNIYFC